MKLLIRIGIATILYMCVFGVIMTVVDLFSDFNNLTELNYKVIRVICATIAIITAGVTKITINGKD